VALFKGRGSKEKVKNEKPKKVPQFKGLSIGKILWSGFLVIAIITLLSAYSSYLLYAELIDNNHDDQQSAIATRAAAVLSARLNGLSRQIEHILDDELIQSALSEHPADDLTPPNTLQTRLTEQLPQLIRQVIIDSNTQPNDQIQPPLSYACLELPALKSPILELHRFGTTEQHLDIAFPIGDASNSRSLLLSFDVRMVNQWLKSIDSGDSYIALQQQIDSHAPLTFGQTGNLQLSGSHNVITHTIPATHFQVTVALPIVESLTQIERILFFANFAVALLFVALALWATLAIVRLILNKDLRTLGSLMKQPSSHIHHILPIKLAELRSCAEEIKGHLGINDNAAIADETTNTKDQENEISPLFQPDITVDVEPVDAQESQPTDETK